MSRMQAKKSKKKQVEKVRAKKIKKNDDLRWYFLTPKEPVKEVNVKP
ncbi:hypothetical protein [Chitinophaga oryziterrae]|nr:hypothetical protein [Chitinophaga oryziterrae]